MLSKLPSTTAIRTARRFLHHSSMQRASAAVASAIQHPDMSHVYVSANSATSEAEWSQQYSFAAPESDFTAQKVAKKNNKNNPLLQVSVNSATMESEWAEQIILADAKKDVEALQAALAVDSTAVNTADMERMMQQCLLLSPESALGAAHVAETMNATAKDELKSLFANNEIPSALPAEDTSVDQAAMDLMLQQMLMSSPESATGFVHVAETLTEDLKADLRMAATPLPTTMEEALQDDTRAIVITSTKAPFRIIHVNQVWEGLCGYSQAEAEHKPIGELLAGAETKTVRQMVDSLKAHPENPQAANLVNYTKDGRKFYNHLQVGPLYSSSEQEQSVEYLVGVLHEVDEQGRGMQQRM